MPEIHAQHLLISGIVQGVGYRWSMQQEALRLGLSGWVRNRRDGSVEAVARGATEQLAQLVSWAHRGPPGAKVVAVNVSPWDEAVAEGFQQIATI